MSYLIQLLGFKELAAIGASGLNRSRKVDGPTTDTDPIEQSSVDKILGPLSLAITGDADRFVVPVDFIANELVENHHYLFPSQVTAALSVLVMAHETTKDKHRVTDEKWEFLRHCRNAAAHNGRWNLVGGEPRLPARWRDIKLSADIHDQPLLKMKGPDSAGSLNLGDPIALLWDIEQDHPAMC